MQLHNFVKWKLLPKAQRISTQSSSAAAAAARAAAAEKHHPTLKETTNSIFSLSKELPTGPELNKRVILLHHG